MLTARALKNPSQKKLIVDKLHHSFNKWLQTESYPSYLNTARVIPLSKEATEFPTLGAIRTIAVLPAVSKVFEKVLLSRLQALIISKNLVHPAQAGFSANKSTETNIDRLSRLILQAKAHAVEERLRVKTPRNRTY